MLLKMKVVISDLHSVSKNGKRIGHYFSLAHNYQHIFGKRCVVAGGPVYMSEFAKSDLWVLPYNIIEGENSIISRLKTFANAISLFKRARGECIVLQQCTTITTFLCILLFYHRKSKLYLIQYSLEGFRMWQGRVLYSLAKRKIDGLICPNEMVGKAYSGIPHCIVPDYLYTGIHELGDDYETQYDNKKYDFCIIGRLSEEKGAIEVAVTFANTKYKLLIAGEPSTNSIRERLHEICDKSSNIDLRTDYLSESAFKELLALSRYSFLNYQGEYSKRSSGIVYDTIFSGVPVVGRFCKALGFVKDYKLGVLFEDINNFNPAEVLNKDTYCNFRNNIVEYCKTHIQYQKQLILFLLGDNTELKN